MFNFPREKNDRNESQPFIIFLLFPALGQNHKEKDGTLKGKVWPIPPEVY